MQREVVQADLRSLNLNAARLRRARTAAYEELRRRLERAGWSAKALRDEHRAACIQPGVRAPEQCEVVRYYVRRWARQKSVTL